MSGPAAPVVPQQVLDDSGDPVAGAKIYTYEAGTTMHLATYTTSALSTANANPIIADSAGRFTAYLLPQAYKFRYDTSADVTLRTVDDVVPSSVVSGSNLEFYGTAGEGLALGDVVYLSDGQGSKTAGLWYKTASTNEYSGHDPPIGIATETISTGAVGKIRTGGVVTGLSGLSTGADYYAGAGATITTTPPANARLIGRAASTTMLVLSIAPSRLGLILPSTCELRLTLTTATPVTASDVTGAAMIYFTPYVGNRVTLWSSADNAWVMEEVAELSLAVSGGTASKPHDVFLDYSAGVPELKILAWTNDTTRATALVMHDGVYCKPGDLEQRYIGTIYLDGSTQAEDSSAKRYVWNMYNRVLRPLLPGLETADSWTYTTGTFREANGSTANRLQFVRGLDEDIVSAFVWSQSDNGAAGVDRYTGIGLDSTTTLATGSLASLTMSQDNYEKVLGHASYLGLPGIGLHFLSWLEQSTPSNTTTWYGDNGNPTLQQSGIQGSMLG